MVGKFRRGRHRAAWVGGAIVLGLIAIGLTAGRALAGDAGPHYRLATAAMGSVDQTLTEVGTVSAVNRATVSFPVAGTVSAVGVTIGEHVATGQLLASLDTTSLSQQLATANASLAGAQQTLAADEAGQTGSLQVASSVQANSASSVQASGSNSTATLAAVRIDTGSSQLTAASRPVASSRTSGSANSPLSKLAAAVTAAQQAVLSAQRALDADLAAAEQALTNCQTALSQPSSPAPSVSPSASPSGSASPSASPSGSGSPSASPSGSADDGSAQCLAAIAQAPGADRVAADRRARLSAENALDAAVRALTTAAGKVSGGTTGTGSSGTGSSGTGLSGTGSARTGSSGTSGRSTGTGGGGSSRPVTAAQLAADQAQIDADQAEVSLAQQDLAAAVLTSPLDGTVAAVSILAGKPVAASSSSANITVIGPGTEQVSTTVGLADIDSVHVGEPAGVRVDGLAGVLTGTVSSVGILNSTSGSSTSYPVTIRLDPTSARLYDGSGASVQILLARVSGVLTVPSSAVHAFGALHTVEVLTNGKPVQVRVTVGAAGSDRTQIRSGLSAGQQVVLADLAMPLPTGG